MKFVAKLLTALLPLAALAVSAPMAQDLEYITSILSERPSSTEYTALGVEGDLAIVKEAGEDFLLLDLADPENIEVLSQFRPGGEPILTGLWRLSIGDGIASYGVPRSRTETISIDSSFPYPGFDGRTFEETIWYETRRFDYSTGEIVQAPDSRTGIGEFTAQGRSFAFQKLTKHLYWQYYFCDFDCLVPELITVRLSTSTLATMFCATTDSSMAPTALTLAGLPTDYVVDGNLVIVIIRDWIHAIQIHSDGSLQALDSLSLPGHGRNIVQSGPYAYIAGDGYLAVVAVQHPLHMRLMNVINTTSSGGSVTLRDNRLTLIESDGFTVFDIATPYAPAPVARSSIGDETYTVVDNGNFIFVTGRPFGLKAFQITEVELVEAGAYPKPRLTTEGVYDVSLCDYMAYVATGSTGLVTVDVSAPAAPDVVSVSSVPENIHRVKSDAVAPILYAMSDNNIWAVDVADPAAPTITNTFAFPEGDNESGVNDFAGSGGTLMVARTVKHTGFYRDSLTLYEPTDSGGFALIGGLQLGSRDCRLSYLDGYAYIAGSRGMHVVDLRDPASPEEVALIRGRSWGVFAQDDLLFVSGMDSLNIGAHPPVKIYDISNPAAPVGLGQLETDYIGYSMAVTNSRLLVNAREKGLRSVDISDPTQPASAGFYSPAGQLTGLSAVSDLIAIADSASLTLLRPDIATAITDSEPDMLPGAFVLGQNYPNPFNPSTSIPFQLSRKGSISLEIVNVLGQKIVTLYQGELSAGSHVIDWNASLVASGIYFYRLRADDEELTRKMLLVK